MDKDNIVDFIAYRGHHYMSQQLKNEELNQLEDLSLALQDLIRKVKEGHTLKQAHPVEFPIKNNANAR